MELAVDVTRSSRKAAEVASVVGQVRAPQQVWYLFCPEWTPFPWAHEVAQRGRTDHPHHAEYML